MQKNKNERPYYNFTHLRNNNMFFFYECTITIQSSSYMYMASGA